MNVIGAVPAAVSFGGYFEKHRDELPDGFLNGASPDSIYILTFDRLPYGIAEMRPEEKSVFFTLWFEEHTPAGKRSRMTAFLSEYMVRRYHPARLICERFSGRNDLSFCGYYPKGKKMQKLIEPWRLMLDDRIFDEEGYIINQGMMKEIPYGWFDTSAKGCGWIAAYNLLKINGMEKTMEECAKGLGKRALLGGVMGSEALTVMMWLRKQGLACRLTPPYDGMALKAAEKSSSGILLYTHSRGAHYAAYRKMPDGRLHFYNAVYGRRNHETQLAEFIRNYALFPVSSLIYVE